MSCHVMLSYSALSDFTFYLLLTETQSSDYMGQNHITQEGCSSAANQRVR